MSNQNTHIKKQLENKVEEIENLLKQNYSVSEISNIIGYNYSAVYNCICRNNLKHYVSINNIGKSRTSKKRYEDYDKNHDLNYNNLYDLYINQKKDLYEIAKMYNVSPSGVLYRMRKLSITTRNKSEASELSYHKKPELKEKHRKNANLGITGIFRKGNNYSNTWIEKQFEQFCLKNNIEYKRPFQITKDTHRYDFLVGKKLIVELDGLYWHNRPKQRQKDLHHEAFAKENGYEVLRFTDKQIKETKGDCFGIITELI